MMKIRIEEQDVQQGRKVPLTCTLKEERDHISYHKYFREEPDGHDGELLRV